MKRMEYVHLGDLIVAAKTNRCGDDDFPVLSITKSDGIVFQSEKFKKRIASKDTADYKVVRRGQLVQGIHIDEANFGIQEIVDIGIVSPAYKIWDIKSNAIVPKYLEIILRSPRSIAYYASRFNGSIKRRERLSDKDFLQMKIPCPPVEEQIYAIELLNKATTLIEQRKQQLAELDNLIKARFVELTESTDTVPTKMGDIATYINGYAFKPVQWEDAGYPIVRIQNLNDANAPYNYYSGKIADKYLIHNGDVLVSWATHLEAYIWKGEEAWLNQHIFKVVFDKIEVDKTYFVYACEEALRQAFRNAHGFKPTMEHIKKADFDAAVVKLPEMHIQKEFATFVKQVDKSKVVVQKAISKSYSLI